MELCVAPSYVSGDARREGPRFVRMAHDVARASGADGLIAGGETTVTVRGAGRGGRNQEAALAVLESGALDGTFVAIATDGVDGTSDAAGAVVDRDLARRASERGLEPATFLDDSDTHAFFERAGGHVVTGPTGTNVADVWIWIAPRA